MKQEIHFFLTFFSWCKEKKVRNKNKNFLRFVIWIHLKIFFFITILERMTRPVTELEWTSSPQVFCRQNVGRRGKGYDEEKEAQNENKMHSGRQDLWLLPSLNVSISSFPVTIVSYMNSDMMRLGFFISARSLRLTNLSPPFPGLISVNSKIYTRHVCNVPTTFVSWANC